MPGHYRAILLGFVLAASSVPAVAFNWPHDPTVNVPLTVAPGDQNNQVAVSDGAGGAIVAWEDARGVDIDIYAQRIDADGNVMWSTEGVAVCTAPGDQGRPQLVSDGAGGAIVIWHDARHSFATDVYAQRADANGNMLWATNGVMVDGPFTAVAAGSSAELRRSSDAGSTWGGEFNVSGQDLYAISMLDIYTGMVAGRNGTVMSTTNGGSLWSNEPTGVGATLYDIEQHNSFTAMAVGSGGRVLTWNGSFWSAIPPLVPETLRGVAYATGQTAVAVGDAGRILRTTNGGANWNTQSSGTSAVLHEVDFATTSVAVAVGDAGTIRRSSDGGVFWTAQTSGTAMALHGVAFADASVGAAVGAGGTILRTTDAGVSWSGVAAPTSDSLFSVAFSDSAHGVAAGANGTVVVTTDGGVTWALRASGVGTTLNAVSMARSFTDQMSPKAVSDDAGGVIIAWEDERNGTIDAYAQRLDANGNRAFLHDTPVAIGIDDQRDLTISTNGENGAYIAWENYTGLFTDTDVYAQGVDASGGLMFGSSTVLSDWSGEQKDPEVAYVGDGAAVVAWVDSRNGLSDIFAIIVYASGFTGWVSDGALICGESGTQDRVQVIADGAGGTIIAWEDTRSAFETEIYAQRVYPNGQGAWQYGGIPIESAPGSSYDFAMAPDGLGGAIISWLDRRNIYSIYASVIDANGIVRGAPDGVPVCTAPQLQTNPQVVADGNNGAIVVWIDYRNESVANTNSDVYAQNIDRHGYLGDVGPSITTVADVPNDQGGVATVSWNASYADAFPQQIITEYSVWRRNEATTSSALSALKMGNEVAVALEHALAVGVSEPLAETLAQGGWVFLNTSPAAYHTEYGYDAPTYGDSTSVGAPLTGFQVIAHTSDPFVFWASNPASGFSIDNLAPSTPLSLAAQEQAVDIELSWSPGDMNEIDFIHYAIYRSNSPGVIPGPSTFLTTTPDTLHTDSNPGTATYFYVVTSVDVHENQSAPSNEASAAIVTGVGGDPSMPDRLALAPNYPNPFNPSTAIRFDLPGAEFVELTIYDVAGRRVQTLVQETRAAGHHQVVWRGLDESDRQVASGVYLYRLKAGSYVEMRRMTLLK